MKLKIVQVPSIAKPIQDSPGFAKKLLADAKLDVMALCGFGCRYCSSNNGNYLRIHRDRFAALTEQQTGERTLPAADPALTFTWPDVIAKLDAQTRARPRSWGAGKTLVFSQLTDAFSPISVADGTTEAALRLVLDRTSFRIRVLTKGAVVASSKWLEFFLQHPGRFVVGLSTGTMDDAWASRIEVGTSSPTARLKATRALQDAGVPTFGMLCPIFPDALQGDGVEQLMDAIRPERCETVWTEPYNDRDNWRAVRDGYPVGSFGAAWMTRVYESGKRGAWSRYATELYQRLQRALRGAKRHHYLLYEGAITAADAPVFAGFGGVLLQGTCTPVLDGEGKATRKSTGWSSNPAIRALQRWEGDGFVGKGSAPVASGAAA